MLLRQMKCFVAVVDCNSFTEASEELYLSQSAISQQIRALEKDLGVELITRGKRKISVTTAGEYFYQHAKILIEEAEKIKRETINIANNPEEQLKVGYLNSYFGMELSQTIQEFVSTYPEVNLSMVCGTHEELYRKLLSGDIDMVLNDQRRAFNPEYVNYNITEAPVYILVSKGHYLSRMRLVTREDLVGTPCILITSQEEQEEEERFYTDVLGFKGDKVFAKNMTEAQMLAVGNRGYIPFDHVGTVPESYSGLEKIPVYIGDSPMRRNFFACWKRERGNYYVEEFAEMANNHINAEVHPQDQGTIEPNRNNTKVRL